jgi:hypothetical protein
MNVPLRRPWTQEQFFSWAEAQDIRYEFDGFQPVAKTGGNAGHSAIASRRGERFDLDRRECLLVRGRISSGRVVADAGARNAYAAAITERTRLASSGSRSALCGFRSARTSKTILSTSASSAARRMSARMY